MLLIKFSTLRNQPRPLPLFQH